MVGVRASKKAILAWPNNLIVPKSLNVRPCYNMGFVFNFSLSQASIETRLETILGGLFTLIHCNHLVSLIGIKSCSKFLRILVTTVYFTDRNWIFKTVAINTARYLRRYLFRHNATVSRIQGTATENEIFLKKCFVCR